MKKLMMALVLIAFCAGSAFAFLYEVKILSKDDVKKLTNDEIVTIYTDAVIEREASKTFHGKAGFTPKEYESYKELLGFIVRLREEMASRELDPPPITDWLK